MNTALWDGKELVAYFADFDTYKKYRWVEDRREKFLENLDQMFNLEPWTERVDWRPDDIIF